MSRILLTNMGSFGDINPIIALALELRLRGHNVVVATHKEYKDSITALGFEFHRLRPDNLALNDSQEMAQTMDLKTGTEYVIKNWACANLHATYTDLLESVKGADFIISGLGVLATRLVAEKLEIPFALVILQPFAFLSVHDATVFPSFPLLSKLRNLGLLGGIIIRQFAKLLTNSWAEPIHQLRHDLGLPPLTGNPFIEDKYSRNLVLAMFSSAFAKPQQDWPTNALLTGFTFYDGSNGKTELTSDLQHFLDCGEPPIIFTLGSAAVQIPGNFYQESAKAAKLLNRRAVLLMGQNPPPDNLPEGMIAVNSVPYSQIFHRACAIVHHGGIGTTAQALRAGRPTLIMPYGLDQPDNAARVERLGTSRTISRQQYIASHVAQQLDKLLKNPGYAAKAAEISQFLQEENGVEVACDAIEKLL